MDDLRCLEQLEITSWKVAKSRSNRQAYLCSSSFSLDCGSYILSDEQDQAQGFQAEVKQVSATTKFFVHYFPVKERRWKDARSDYPFN